MKNFCFFSSHLLYFFYLHHCSLSLSLSLSLSSSLSQEMFRNWSPEKIKKYVSPFPPKKKTLPKKKKMTTPFQRLPLTLLGEVVRCLEVGSSVALSCCNRLLHRYVRDHRVSYFLWEPHLACMEHIPREVTREYAERDHSAWPLTASMMVWTRNSYSSFFTSTVYRSASSKAIEKIMDMSGGWRRTQFSTLDLCWGHTRSARHVHYVRGQHLCSHAVTFLDVHSLRLFCVPTRRDDIERWRVTLSSWSTTLLHIHIDTSLSLEAIAHLPGSLRTLHVCGGIVEWNRREAVSSSWSHLTSLESIHFGADSETKSNGVFFFDLAPWLTNLRKASIPWSWMERTYAQIKEVDIDSFPCLLSLDVHPVHSRRYHEMVSVYGIAASIRMWIYQFARTRAQFLGGLTLLPDDVPCPHLQGLRVTGRYAPYCFTLPQPSLRRLTISSFPNGWQPRRRTLDLFTNLVDLTLFFEMDHENLHDMEWCRLPHLTRLSLWAQQQQPCETKCDVNHSLLQHHLSETLRSLGTRHPQLVELELHGWRWLPGIGGGCLPLLPRLRTLLLDVTESPTTNNTLHGSSIDAMLKALRVLDANRTSHMPRLDTLTIRGWNVWGQPTADDTSLSTPVTRKQRKREAYKRRVSLRKHGATPHDTWMKCVSTFLHIPRIVWLPYRVPPKHGPHDVMDCNCYSPTSSPHTIDNHSCLL